MVDLPGMRTVCAAYVVPLPKHDASNAKPERKHYAKNEHWKPGKF